MEIMDNAMFSVTIEPVSNEQILAGSVLPDRFVSSSESQQRAIMGDDLGSTVGVDRLIYGAIVPIIVA